MKPTNQTVVRVALLVIALVNLLVSSLGIVPEEVVGNEAAYQTWSAIITTLVALVNAWKNNSFTPEAIEADKYLAELRAKKNE